MAASPPRKLYARWRVLRNRLSASPREPSELPWAQIPLPSPSWHGGPGVSGLFLQPWMVRPSAVKSIVIPLARIVTTGSCIAACSTVDIAAGSWALKSAVQPPARVSVVAVLMVTDAGHRAGGRTAYGQRR